MYYTVSLSLSKFEEIIYDVNAAMIATIVAIFGQ